MKTLFLVDGAAGTGKSDLLRYLAIKKKTVVATLQKYTTRGIRDEEEKRRLALDLRFPPDSHERFMARTEDPGFYWYQYGLPEEEQLYGLYRADIEEAFGRRDICVVIVRDRDTIDQIRDELPSVRCVSVFVYTDRDLVIKRLRADGYTEEEIQFRLSRLPLAWADYVKYSTKYNEKIINSSDRGDFGILIEALFSKYTTTQPSRIRVSSNVELPLVRPLIGFRRAMEERLAKFPYDRNVFLMMKFRGKNVRTGNFIKKTLESHGLVGVKANDDEWDITGNTYNPVAVLYCCKFGIALFDEPEPGNEYSPNVAYELGMMHDHWKQGLIIRHSGLNQVPFDLVKDLHVDYSDPLELDEIVGRWVRGIASEGALNVEVR